MKCNRCGCTMDKDPNTHMAHCWYCNRDVRYYTRSERRVIAQRVEENRRRAARNGETNKYTLRDMLEDFIKFGILMLLFALISLFR